MVVTGMVMNLGEWPGQVGFVVYKAWWFNEKWHLIGVLCYDPDWNHSSEWPLWAMTEKQETRMIDVVRQLAPRPHP